MDLNFTGIKGASRSNYGKDIFKTYTDNTHLTGQGLTTNLYYGEGRISYLLNPKYNLRLEIGGIFRHKANAQMISNTTLYTFGLRSSFRNLYYDF